MDAARSDVKRHHGLVRVGALGQRRRAARHDRERAADLRRLRPLRPAGRALRTRTRWTAGRFPTWARLGGWLAGRPQLALRAGLAVRDHRPASTSASWLLSGEWRSLLFRPSDVGPAIADAALLSAAPARPSAAGQAQRAPEGRLHVHRASWARSSVLTGFAIYKPVQLAWLTALFGGYELARYWHFWAVWLFVGLHPAPRGPGVPGRSGLAAGDDHRLVPREVPEP